MDLCCEGNHKGRTIFRPTSLSRRPGPMMGLTRPVDVSRLPNALHSRQKTLSVNNIRENLCPPLCVGMLTAMGQLIVGALDLLG